MPNLPLAFAELLVGGVILEAAIKGAGISDVVKGTATMSPITGLTPAAASAVTSTATGAGGLASTASSGLSGLLGGTGGPGLDKAYGLAQSLVGTPYNMGGHATAINETVAQVKRLGTDCSGYVSDLMGPQGLGIWHTAYATPGIPTAPGIVPGKGSQITLWNNANPGAAGHVWIQFAVGGVNRFFEEAGGGLGAHEMSAGEAQQYLSSGQYQPFHPTGY